MGNPWAYDFSAIGARTAPLLVIIGSDQDARERGLGGSRIDGNSDIYQLIPETLPFEQLNLGKQFLKQQGRPDPARFDCVLNLVTDPDQHPQTLERLRKLLRGYKGRVINRPEVVLRTSRDQVARRLAGIDGLRVPRVIRLRNPRPGAASAAIARAGLAFPLIVRHAGSHTGRIVALAETPEQLDDAANGPGEFVATEFVDFQSDDGLYRKYRFWSFGERTIFRHLAIADEWNVHVKTADRFMFDRPELVEEEVRLMERPEGDFPAAVHACFGAVRRRLGLDFFGLDFAFDRAGAMILFEANATMSYFPLVVDPRFAFRQKLLAPAEQAFMAMLSHPPATARLKN